MRWEHKFPYCNVHMAQDSLLCQDSRFSAKTQNFERLEFLFPFQYNTEFAIFLNFIINHKPY